MAAQARALVHGELHPRGLKDRSAPVRSTGPACTAERPGRAWYPVSVASSMVGSSGVAIGAQVESEPAVCGGTVYLGSHDRNCYALDAVTGALRWRFDTGSWVRRTPAVSNGVVFLASENGNAYAVGAENGEQRWQREVGQSATPVVAGGLMYLVQMVLGSARNDPSRLTALDTGTGEVRWQRTLPHGAASAPAVADGVVYVQGATAQLSAFQASTGEPLWHQASLEGYLAVCAPTVADGTVYIGTGAGQLRAFNAATGSLRWHRTASGAIDHSPAVSDGVVYFGDRSGGAYAVDASTGDERWHLPDEFGAGAFAISGSSGWVAIGKWHRDLYRIDLADGSPEWRCSLDAAVSDPVIADGVLYVATRKGKVLALDALTGRKPSFRGRRGRP